MQINIGNEYKYHSKVRIDPYSMRFFVAYSEISIVQNIKFWFIFYDLDLDALEMDIEIIFNLIMKIDKKN